MAAVAEPKVIGLGQAWDRVGLGTTHVVRADLHAHTEPPCDPLQAYNQQVYPFTLPRLFSSCVPLGATSWIGQNGIYMVERVFRPGFYEFYPEISTGHCLQYF